MLAVEPSLDYPGTIEAAIPHDELFPDGSSHRQVEARFVVTVKPKGTLLEAVVYLKRDERPLWKVETKLVSAASWVPQSEFDPGDGTLRQASDVTPCSSRAGEEAENAETKKDFPEEEEPLLLSPVATIKVWLKLPGST